MKLAIVANHRLQPTGMIIARVAASLAIMNEEDPSSVLLLRANNAVQVSSHIERAALDIANHLGVSHTYLPAPGGGREGTYQRDWALVQQSDRVMAFFDRNMDLNTGTAHVVHAAIQKSVPVEAWAVDVGGMLSLIGSADGYEMDSEGIEWFHQSWEKNRAELQFEVYKAVTDLFKVPPYLTTTTTPSVIGTSPTITSTRTITSKPWTLTRSFELS